VFLPEPTVHNFESRYKLDPDTRTSPFTIVQPKDWANISLLAVHVQRIGLHPINLQHVLNSTAFLEFDEASGLMRETSVYRALYLLSGEIRAFMFSNTEAIAGVVFRNVGGKHSDQEPISIPTMELAALLHLLDRWINIAKIGTAILQHLTGRPFTMPRLRPRSPFYGMDERLVKEDVSIEQVQDFVATKPPA